MIYLFDVITTGFINMFLVLLTQKSVFSDEISVIRRGVESHG